MKESEIVDFSLGASLKDGVLKQKPTQAGQRTSFKAFVTTADYNDHHVDLGVACSRS